MWAIRESCSIKDKVSIEWQRECKTEGPKARRECECKEDVPVGDKESLRYVGANLQLSKTKRVASRPVRSPYNAMSKSSPAQDKPIDCIVSALA